MENMIPDPRIIENIRKLKELGMSKEDIKDNLVKMGLAPKDCDELLTSVFGAEPEQKTTEIKKTQKENDLEESPRPVGKGEIPDDLFSDDMDVTKLTVPEIPEAPEKEVEIPDITKGLNIGGLEYTKENDILSLDDLKSYEPVTPTAVAPQKKEQLNSTLDLWQTGLATTINTKINEVEVRQQKMEEYLKTKIDSELDKYRQMQDATKQLLSDRINEQILEQTTAISVQFTKQLALLKVEQAKINKKAEEINSNKQEIENQVIKFQEFQAQLTEANKVNQENINKIIATTTVKLNTKIKEINDILALQSKITQGLIKNTQTAIGEEIKKLIDFKDTINKQINPQQLYDKLNQLESFKQQLANRYEQRFEVVKNEFLAKAREAFKDEITKELSDITKVKDTIVAKTDPELINKKLKELESFETQLINAIDEKISQALKIYEGAITQEIRSKINTIDEEIKRIDQVQTTVELANEKVKELNQFRDQFIAIIDKNIEKINNTYSMMENKIKEIERQKTLI